MKRDGGEIMDTVQWIQTVLKVVGMIGTGL